MIMILNFACNAFAGTRTGTGVLAGTAATMYRATVTQQPVERIGAGSPGNRAAARGTRARGTRQAQALAAALASLPGFCSAQEIHAELRR